MKYFSLFSGIGGFELGILNAYVDTTDGKKNGRSKATSKTRDSQQNASDFRGFLMDGHQKK